MNDYADRRDRLRASLHFVDPEWLDVAFAIAAATVPEVGDLDSYAQAVEIVAFRVLKEKHHLHLMPVSRTVQ